MPKAKINKTVIDSIPYTDAGQLIIWDTELKGFGLLVNHASKSFIVQRDLNRRADEPKFNAILKPPPKFCKLSLKLSSITNRKNEKAWQA